MIFKSDYPLIKWVLTAWGEFPTFYSDNACRIIADKYFAENDEESYFNTVRRVVTAIAQYGENNDYFDTKEDTLAFAKKLGGILLWQQASFNSPVWFNVGVEDHPQCSACFIQSVDDTMEDILDLVKKEGMLFKYGSGTGTNFSTLRHAGAPLSKGGHASGVPDFMKLLDAGAGVIKSGGKTRRAAKMAILNHDHGDIYEFIWCKAREEFKIKQDVENGIPVGEAVARAEYQNANNSVRVTDAFMEQAVLNDGSERGLLRQMAKAAWECGDPGIQFDNACQRGMPDIGIRNNATNPCSEFVFIDESACNLASINLQKVNTHSNLHTFTDVVHTMIKAMDILVSMSSYPTETIAHNSHKYRPLGLGYTGLGAHLMERGIPYGSDAAIDEVTRITQRMNFHAEEASKQLAARLGGFPLANGGRSRLRNAQLTLIAPTGTISFAMDAESTGIEPVFAAKQIKHLAGGGDLDIVPRCVAECGDPKALKFALSDNPDEVVTPEEHLKMMAAAQPHLTGAISKTINMPADCTVDDIFSVYVAAWEMGLKCVAVFRDGCKAHQPLNVNKTAPASTVEDFKRTKMPPERHSLTHKFTVGGVTGYLTVGFPEPGGMPGELFVNISKEGSTLGGITDAWATAFSLGLQHGVPLRKLVSKYAGARFEPAGFTDNPRIPSATSIVDYVARWIEQKFLTTEEGKPNDVAESVRESDIVGTGQSTGVRSGDTCPECGSLTERTGTCHACRQCGWSGGCG